MAVGLVIGGGAPNLPLMSGALLALDEAGVEFDVISTTGAGMLIGLMYAAPKHGTREETLKATREMGVHDAIYKVFPVNYKIFHKSGTMAEAYTKFHQTWLAQMPRENETQRFMSDITQFWMAAMCPGNMAKEQNGLCQPPPWIDLVVDFDKLKDFPGDFLISAYCIEDAKEIAFEKEEITADHFKAALAMPLIYSPYKMDGKTYLEGSAFDTLAFDPGHVMSRNLVDTVIYFDVLGERKLIQEPTSIYDAWVHSIINPLTRLAELDSKSYKLTGKEVDDDLEVLRMPFGDNISEEQWPKVLDWSYSNMSTLFDIGYETGKQFVKDNADRLGESHKNRSKNVIATLKEMGVYEKFMDIVNSPAALATGWSDKFDFEKEFKDLSPADNMKLFTAFIMAGKMFDTPKDPNAKWAKTPPPEKVVC
jgi:predicted acylesterase/phospholipase RssA